LANDKMVEKSNRLALFERHEPHIQEPSSNHFETLEITLNTLALWSVLLFIYKSLWIKASAKFIIVKCGEFSL